MEMETIISDIDPLWIKANYTNPQERRAHTSTLVQDYIFTIGGTIGDNPYTNEVFAYNIKTDVWQEIIPEGDEPTARHRHSACLYQYNKIIIFGGYSGFVMADAYVLEVNIQGNEIKAGWKLLEARGEDNHQRASHTADIYRNSMFVFGGRDKPKNCTNDLWRLNLDSLEWSLCQLDGIAPGERLSHCSALYNGKLYIFGGFSDKSNKIVEDIFVIDLETMRSHQVYPEGAYFEARHGAVSQVYKGKVYIFGGKIPGVGNSNEVFSFNLKDNTYSQVETKGQIPDGRSEMTSVLYTSNMIVLGGITNNKENPFEIYNLELKENDSNNSFRIRKGDPSLFISQFKDSLSSTLYSDIKFKVQGEIIQAHRIILATRCKFFHNMFTSGMSESESSLIEIHDVKLQTFRALLDFIYSNQVGLNETLALDLLALSDKYLLKDLKSLCEEFLSQNITLRNIVKLANLADNEELPVLRKAITNYVPKNLNRILENPDIYQLPNSFYWDIINNINKMNKWY